MSAQYLRYEGLVFHPGYFIVELMGGLCVVEDDGTTYLVQMLLLTLVADANISLLNLSKNCDQSGLYRI